jgi:hypothetical protein
MFDVHSYKRMDIVHTRMGVDVSISVDLLLEIRVLLGKWKTPTHMCVNDKWLTLSMHMMMYLGL